MASACRRGNSAEGWIDRFFATTCRRTHTPISRRCRAHGVRPRADRSRRRAHAVRAVPSARLARRDSSHIADASRATTFPSGSSSKARTTSVCCAQYRSRWSPLIRRSSAHLPHLRARRTSSDTATSRQVERRIPDRRSIGHDYAACFPRANRGDLAAATDLLTATLPRQATRHDEQQVGQSVEVAQRVRRPTVVFCRSPGSALGAATYRACEWQIAAARLPPGKTNSLNGGNAAFRTSSSRSSRATCSAPIFT